MSRLAIHAQNRFRPREANQHPAAVFKLELETIHGDKFGYFQAAESLGVVVHDDLLARIGVAAKGTVYTVVEIFTANFGEQVFQ